MSPPDLVGLIRLSTQADEIDAEWAGLNLSVELALHILKHLHETFTEALACGWDPEDAKSFVAACLRTLATHLES